MPVRLLLLRHGQSTWNAEGRWQGWSDPPLSPLGEEQAAEASRRLAGEGITGVVSSDLERARSTAALVAAGLGLGPVVTEPALREYDVGDWEGLTRAEIEAGWPDQLVAWRNGRLSATPGGETRSDFLRRLTAGLDRVASSEVLGDAPVVVTHGGVIRGAEQVVGAERSMVVENLAGRWFEVRGDGLLVAGEVVRAARAHLTAPPSP